MLPSQSPIETTRKCCVLKNEVDYGKEYLLFSQLLCSGNENKSEIVSWILLSQMKMVGRPELQG